MATFRNPHLPGPRRSDSKRRKSRQEGRPSAGFSEHLCRTNAIPCRLAGGRGSLRLLRVARLDVLQPVAYTPHHLPHDLDLLMRFAEQIAALEPPPTVSISGGSVHRMPDSLPAPGSGGGR